MFLQAVQKGQIAIAALGDDRTRGHFKGIECVVRAKIRCADLPVIRSDRLIVAIARKVQGFSASLAEGPDQSHR
jgi:hypothetical protein